MLNEEVLHLSLSGWCIFTPAQVKKIYAQLIRTYVRFSNANNNKQKYQHVKFINLSYDNLLAIKF